MSLEEYDKNIMSIPGSIREKELSIPREILISNDDQEIASNSRNKQNYNYENIDDRIIQQLKQEVLEDLKKVVTKQSNNQDNLLNISRESGLFNLDKEVVKEKILQEIKQELKQSLNKDKKIVKEEILQEIKQELRQILNKENK